MLKLWTEYMKVGYNFLGVIVKRRLLFLYFRKTGNIANSENIKAANENLKKF